MNYGLYTAYLGMRARMRTLDVIAGNLANSATTGFKVDRLYYRSVEAAEYAPDYLAGLQADLSATPQISAGDPQGTPAAERTSQGPGPSRALGVLTGGMMDFTTGSMRQTEQPLDVAMAGDGFLVVQTPRGERYTRNGALTIDAAGQLVTQQGDLVVGLEGPITIQPGEVSIGQDGRIASGGQPMGQLKIVRFQDPRTALLKEGHSLFVAASGEQPVAAPQTIVNQGVLESSNVNTVAEMAAMMQNNREFESLQRSISLMMSLRKVTSDIGKI
jgi:flagellar basal-body rod protein FlgF